MAPIDYEAHGRIDFVVPMTYEYDGLGSPMAWQPVKSAAVIEYATGHAP